MKRLLKCIIVGCWFLSIIISIDMFLLKGKLKLLWIAVANTTSSSPFSTDGQSNYMLILTLLIAGIVAYIAYKILDNFSEVK